METVTRSHSMDADPEALDERRVAALLLRARRSRGGRGTGEVGLSNTPGVDPGARSLQARVVRLATSADRREREPRSRPERVDAVREDHAGAWIWRVLVALAVIALAVAITMAGLLG